MIAVLLSWPLGYYYLDWATYTGVNIIRHYRSGYVSCDGSWRSADGVAGGRAERQEGRVRLLPLLAQ